MKTILGVFAVAAFVTGVLAGGPSTSVVAQTTSPPAAKPAAKPKVGEAAVVTVRGTVEAIDKEKQTVTLKGPQRSITIEVRDPKKLEAIKVGDPVVGKYYEALAIEVKKPGTATPGITTQQGAVTSKAGETPAGAVGRQVTLTVTVVAVDQKAHTVTVKGPEGRTETVKARDPKNLEGVKAGDLIELTYTQALAVSLDKSAAK